MAAAPVSASVAPDELAVRRGGVIRSRAMTVDPEAKLARAKAALSGRDFVTPEDVKAIAVPALGHRLMVRPELWVQRLRGEDVVEEALETVPTPPAEDRLRTAEA